MCDSNSSSDICLDTTERNINDKLNNLLKKKNKNKKPCLTENNSDLNSCTHDTEISEIKSDILKILLLIKGIARTDNNTYRTSNTDITSNNGDQIEQLKSDVDDQISSLKSEIESLRKTVQSVFTTNCIQNRKK
jgi:hypothetical protein